MSDNRSIQKSDGGQRAGAIMTPQGPAIIQVIDIPSGGLGMPGGMNGAPVRKVGGINILGAILRRWWLVLIVTLLIGGGGFYASNNLIKPVYAAKVRISWNDTTGDGQGIARLVNQASDVLTSRDIPLLVAADPDMQLACPWLVRGRDLNDPAVQADVIKQLRDVAVAEPTKQTQMVDIGVTRRDPVEAARMANAFGRGFIKYCQDTMRGNVLQQIEQAQQLCNDARLTKGTLIAEKTKLAIDNNFERDAQVYAANVQLATEISRDQLTARVALAAAEAKLKQLETGVRRPDQDLEALKLVEDEKKNDNVLQTYNTQLIGAMGTLQQELATKTELNPDVKRARDQVNRLNAMVLQREAEISSIIRTRIDERFKLIDATTVAAAKQAVNDAQEKLKVLEGRLKEMDERAKKLAWVKSQIEALDSQIGLASRDYDANWQALQDLKKADAQLLLNSGVKIAEYATAPDKPDQDKRVKVQAAGLVGGLFLGMLLALLVDKFDKRLRDPRDVEPLLGAPLLGTIPRIGELKRVKGEHARNLIAEEFRIIRTQLLFGNPQLNYKIIAITSPQPGDGKTSLAVNLAISIAKAGRRVLLIDGDLRKPDVHRIFNIQDSPGFAEVIAGSHDPGAVIKKSDIDGLEVLPAGTPITRPSELLSRPEVSRVLAAMGEVYDHIIIDTAPLLPVSDTHVLVGLVDGVMCSFNADVDRNTVTVVQDILRRSRAHVIGTVMNQVKYKQSGAFHRGKNAYSSYYTSDRGVGANGAINMPGKVDPGVATLTKH